MEGPTLCPELLQNSAGKVGPGQTRLAGNAERRAGGGRQGFGRALLSKGAEKEQTSKVSPKTEDPRVADSNAAAEDDGGRRPQR